MDWLLAAEEGLSLGEFRLATAVAEVIEIAAIAVIGVAVLIAAVTGLASWVRADGDHAFEVFKRVIARGLLIGLDLLIAADVIRTVVLEATLQNAVVLGLLVVIRTFLSWTLVLEVEGRWPWQRATEPG
jgi:uncharacterized membrane protein